MTDNTRPEAELEALLSSALAAALPHIPRAQFHHQTRFTVCLGHHEYQVDGEQLWAAAGRADIILYYNGRALAVVELKREDKTLTDADRKQGLSYANQIIPRPPLVMVTNGRETRLYHSTSGELWVPDTDDGHTVAKLLDNAAAVAAAGLAWAIEVLMGPDAGLWSSVVRTRTQELLQRLSGDVGEVDKPFARDLSFPRVATLLTEQAFQQGVPIVLISGPPLIGKSHVLRQFADKTASSDEYAVFMVRAGAGGAGLFQRIANVLSSALEWNVGPSEVRQWLRRMSLSDHGPTLVLALDGVAAGSAVGDDLEELAESNFGPRLRILATVDDTRALLAGANRRDSTALAAKCLEIPLGPLNQAEFRYAREILAARHIGFTQGADLAEEFRVPWVLQALVADVIFAPEYETSTAVLPASLGVNLVQHARERFARFTEALRGYRLLARDTIADIGRASPELALERAHAFAVRRDALSPESREEVENLISQGWLGAHRHAGGEDILVPHAPELFLSELALAASVELEARVGDNPRTAGHWLADEFDGEFLGDLIGAQAVLDMAQRTKGIPSDLILGLLERKPAIQTFHAGVFALPRQDGSLQNIRVMEDGKVFLADDHGEPYGEGIDLDGDPPQVYSDMAAWMILSQLARVPCVADVEGRPRADLGVLLEVGTCPIPLMRPARDPIGHLQHEIAGHGIVLCTDNGVIEPATAALQQAFSECWRGLDDWFDEALSRQSLALMNRIHIALRPICGNADSQKAQWANEMLIEVVDPAISALLGTVPESIEKGIHPVHKKMKPNANTAIPSDRRCARQSSSGSAATPWPSDRR